MGWVVERRQRRMSSGLAPAEAAVVIAVGSAVNVPTGPPDEWRQAEAFGPVLCLAAGKEG
ncbi:hypothetical protein [Streptomyces mirabilis]|uniref:hypothetical protein n=1 Tax=Streptomyces mirabilis TaxID=68239 RepID=UPI0036A44FA2